MQTRWAHRQRERSRAERQRATARRRQGSVTPWLGWAWAHAGEL